MGFPSNVSAEYIRPLLKFPLCGMASTLAAGFLHVPVHVLPQIRRILAVEGGKRNDLTNAVLTVAENHGAMQIVPRVRRSTRSRAAW